MACPVCGGATDDIVRHMSEEHSKAELEAAAVVHHEYLRQMIEDRPEVWQSVREKFGLTETPDA